MVITPSSPRSSSARSGPASARRPCSATRTRSITVAPDVVITAESASDDDHIAACEARYRSYNAETDMYLSFGGDWKLCRL